MHNTGRNRPRGYRSSEAVVESLWYLIHRTVSHSLISGKSRTTAMGPYMRFVVVEIRLSNDRLIFIMGIAVLVRRIPQWNYHLVPNILFICVLQLKLKIPFAVISLQWMFELFTLIAQCTRQRLHGLSVPILSWILCDIWAIQAVQQCHISWLGDTSHEIW